MGLFLSEAITNALKYSDGAPIAVIMRIDGNELLLEVADHGSGLPSGCVEGGSGLRLMRSLAAGLDGHVEFDKNSNTGLCVRFVLPLP